MIVRNKRPIPFDSLPLEEEIRSFVKKTSRPMNIDKFILRDPRQAEEALKNGNEKIRNFFFFYEVEDDEDQDFLLEQITEYMFFSLGSRISMARIVSNRKTAEALIKAVIKDTGVQMGVPEDFSLLTVACDRPQYTALAVPASKMNGLSFSQFMKIMANVPGLELDRTSAGLVGQKRDKEDIYGIKVFAVAVNVIDSQTHRQVDQIMQDAYCDFRETVHLAWIDAFFNPGRLSLLGHSSGVA